MLKKLVFLDPIRPPDHSMEDLYYPDRHHPRRVRHQRRHLWSLRQPSSSPTPVGHATYTPDDASHEESPFPASGPPLTDPTPRNYFTERAVHQVYFKIFTFADDRRELWVTEIPANGYARTREPEQYFYFLTGDDVHARHTTDYWRFFFNILNRHFDSPDYYWHHNHHFHPLGADPPSSTPSPTQTPQASIATLAAQLQERLFAPPTSGTGPTATTRTHQLFDH